MPGRINDGQHSMHALHGSGHDAHLHAPLRAQLIRVPEVLPPAAGGARPVPSFAGVAMLPLKRSLYASTLSQLSALSASFGPVSLQQPQVQVWEIEVQ